MISNVRFRDIANGARVRRSDPRLSSKIPLGIFVERILIAIIILAIAAVVYRLAEVLIVLFGAILIAVGLCAAARLVTRFTNVGSMVALAGVIFAGLVMFGGVFWIFGSVIAAQMDDVFKAAPAGFKLFLERLDGNPYGRQALEQVRGVNVIGATGWLTSFVTPVIGSATRGLGYFLVACFMAVYLAAQPERYRHFVLRLTPPVHQVIADELFSATGDVLLRWLIGQFVVMATIGVLTGLGLWLMGIEAAIALGLMGGLLCFIPFVGAILAAIPATLVALTQGPVFAGLVILMYVAVHFIEGNFITPLVQAEATALPPVLAILSTVVFGILFGPSGVLLAAPLTLLVLAAIEVLYVRQGLGQPPEIDHFKRDLKDRAAFSEQTV